MTDAPWQSLGPGDFVRDYRHAARIFGSNDFIRAPKSKYLFYVVITTNPAAVADNFGSPPNFKSELSYLVKNVELPKFEIEVQEHNQYNRKVLSHRQIKYNPVTIKFHDDNAATLRDFWQTYYNYYFMDGRYTDSDFKKDDKYKSRTSGTSNRWGMDTNAKAPYLTKIDIYSLYHGYADKITLESPMITSFNHDSHDYADNTGVMEATMTVRYTGVRYEQNPSIDAKTGLPGFGQDAPEAYDTEMSSLVNGTGEDMPVLDANGNPLPTPNAIANPNNETPQEEPIAKPSTDAEVQGASPELVNSQGENTKQDDSEDTAKAAQDEIRRFLRWVRKSPERSFNFQNVPVVYADVLNKFVETKDYDSARWYAERYLA